MSTNSYYPWCRSVRMNMLRTGRLAPHRTRTATKRPTTTQVHASLDYRILAPILLGAGALGGAWVNSQLSSRLHAANSQTAEGNHPTASSSSHRRRRAQAPQQQLQGQPQQQQEQEQQQQVQTPQQQEQDAEPQQDEHDQLRAYMDKQQKQIAQLTRDKQQLQQEAKKQIKAYEKLEGKLLQTQQELAQVKAQHSQIAIELLQTRQDLDQANKQLQILRQREVDLTALLEDISSNRGSSSDGDHIINDAQVAAASDVRPKCIAVLGGKELKASHRDMFEKLYPGYQIRHYGSMSDKGLGDIARLEQSLKQESIDEVFMLVRWNGHGDTQRISALCRRLKIPVNWLDSPQIAKMKGAAAEAAAALVSAASVNEGSG